MMTVYELVAALGGEIALNKASVRIGSNYTVIGEIINGEMTLTDAGRALLPPEPEPAPAVEPKPRGRPRAKRFSPYDELESEG